MKIISIAVALLIPLCAFAQQPANQAEQEKQLREAIDNEVDKYTSYLDLEDWQVFYLDSILTHNYTERYAELMQMSQKKMSNNDLFYQVSDKWIEANYVAIQKILDEEQWAKYLKQGAAKEKKARDKRTEKMKNN